MNYRDMTVAIVIIISVSLLVGFDMFVKWQTGNERCTIAVETQHELMITACRATIEENLASIDKEFCATWDAEVELKRLENSGVKKP